MVDNSLHKMVEQPDIDPAVMDAQRNRGPVDPAVPYSKARRAHPAPDPAEREKLLSEIQAQAREWASRAPDVTEEELTDMIDEAIHAVRSQRR